jgi:hypothetical protein
MHSQKLDRRADVVLGFQIQRFTCLGNMRPEKVIPTKLDVREIVNGTPRLQEVFFNFVVRCSHGFNSECSAAKVVDVVEVCAIIIIIILVGE